MTISVSVLMSSVTSGASSTPASAASMAPSAQPSWLNRTGAAPVSAASSRSSTTARVAIPGRVL